MTGRRHLVSIYWSTLDRVSRWTESNEFEVEFRRFDSTSSTVVPRLPARVPRMASSGSSGQLSASNSRVELSLSLSQPCLIGTTLRPTVHYKADAHYASTSLRLVGETRATIMGKERWVRRVSSFVPHPTLPKPDALTRLTAASRRRHERIPRRSHHGRRRHAHHLGRALDLPRL